MAGGMSMTFSSWDQYQVNILFIGWEINSPLEFALSWFAVAFATIFYRYMVFLNRFIQLFIISNLWKGLYCTMLPFLYETVFIEDWRFF